MSKHTKRRRIISALMSLVLVFSLFSTMFVASAADAGPGAGVPQSSPATTPDFNGKGTEEEPFRIASRDDLVKMSSHINRGESYIPTDAPESETKYTKAYYELTQDIDFSTGEGKWVAIGRSNAGISDTNAFEGTFDGKGHTISNFSVDNRGGETRHYTTGFFGVNLGTIKNLFLKDANVAGNFDVAILCSRNRGTIENCATSGTVSGSYLISGFVAMNSGGTIKNCYTSASIAEGGSGAIGVFYGTNTAYLENKPSGASKPSAITNCYYLASSNASHNNTVVEGSLESFTQEELASGKIAYLLAKGEGGDVWEQDFSKSEKYPVLNTDSEKKTVYAVDFYFGKNDENLLYSQYGNNGATIAKPEIPEQDIGGYGIGEKWYSDAQHNREFQFDSSTISADTKLYCETKPIEYTVTCDLNEGSIGGTTGTKTYTYNVESADFTLDTPKKDGYTFKGWTGTDLSGEAVETVTITKGSTGNKTYYAHYVEQNAPKVKVTLGEHTSHTWNYFEYHPEENVFYNTSQKITVEVTDADEEPTVEYIILDAGSGKEEEYTTDMLEEAIADPASGLSWTAYDKENGITIDPPMRAAIIVVKVTDTAGNVAYVSTSGIVLDIETPILNRLPERETEPNAQVTEGNLYCVQLRFKVDEDYLDTVKLDSADLEADENGVYTVTGSGKHHLEVKDKAGNTATVNFTISAHVNGETVKMQTLAPDCDDEGQERVYVSCKNCGLLLSDTVNVLPANGHKWHVDETTDQDGWARLPQPEKTCENRTLKARTCDVCGLHETGDMDPLAHEWETNADGTEKYTIDQEATCLVPGSKSVHCKNCAATKDPQTIPTIEHSPGNAKKENYTPATCTDNGGYDLVFYCKTCGTEMSKSHTTLYANGHDFGGVEWTTIDPKDSCEDTAILQRQCGECEYIEIRNIDASAHEPEEKDGQEVWTVITPPGCTSDGTRGVYCKVCGNLIKTDTISPVGHTKPESFTRKNIVEPTCTTPGEYDDVLVCTVCGEEFSGQLVEGGPVYPVHTTEPPINHNWTEWQDLVMPNCDDEGTQQRECLTCGLKETRGASATGHEWGTNEDGSYKYTIDLEPTCTEEGSESVHCKKCAATQPNSSRVIPAKGHDWIKDSTTDKDGWKAVDTGDCTTQGRDRRTCKVCGTEEYRGILDENAHTWNDYFTEDVPATCTTDGSESIHCPKCGETKESRVIPAHGHDWSDWAIIEEESCEDENTQMRVCRICGITETEGITPGAHEWEKNEDGTYKYTIDLPASCTEDGSRSVHCKNCLVRMGQEAIPATGHTFGEWYSIGSEKNPDAMRRDCEVCGFSEFDGLDKSAHTWETNADGTEKYTVDVEPTCTTDGSKSIHCTVCDATKDSQAIPALGHDYDTTKKVVVEEATCDKEGKQAYKCTRCDEYLEPETIAALGHEWDTEYTVDKEPTCLTDGSKSIHCIRCDAVKESVVIKARGYHVPVTTGAKEATCTEDGYTGDTVCQDCGTVLQKGETIPAKGHNYENGVCTVCGAEQTSPNTGTALAVLGSISAPLFIGFAVPVFAARKRRSFQK